MTHLFAGTQRGKIRKCRRKGNASLRRNPRGHTHQILLSNPHVDIALGERVAKTLHARRNTQVRRQPDNIRILLGEV
ncbi:hypothetical protein D3C86_2033530 [compost metagenome]